MRTFARCVRIALLLVLCGAGLAEPSEARERRHPEKRLKEHLAELDLSSDQEEKINAILEEASDRRKQMRALLHEEFERLHALLEHEPPDESAILAQVERVGGLKTERHKAMMRTLLRIRAVLTPEQRRKLIEMRRFHHPRRKHRGSGGDWERAD